MTIRNDNSATSLDDVISQSKMATLFMLTL